MTKNRANLTFVGLDVHADTISIAVAEGDSRGRGRSVGTIPNQPDSVRKAMKKLGPKKSLQVCYEAGPTGYALYWQLEALGIACEVIAPTLVPVKAGDRVKTDRLGKFLLRLGRRRDTSKRAWGQAHMNWINVQRFEHGAQTSTFLDYRNEVEHHTERVAQIEKAIDQAIEQAPERMQEIVKALQSLRGVAKITAVTLVSEIGSFERFSSAPKFMAYLGLVPCEYSSGKTRTQGRITKTGNAHMRRVLGEAAFCSRLHPRRGPVLKKRQEGQSQAILDIAWQAQKRLYAKHTRMMLQRKSHQITVTALSRELAGFVWSVARQRETELAN